MLVFNSMFLPNDYACIFFEWRNISSTLQNVAAGVDHKLHDGLENEGECRHGDEHRDEGLEELHQGLILVLVH